MSIDLFELLKVHPSVLLFTVIGTGYLIGKIKIRNLELGSAGGVLFSALFFGHFGLELPKIIEVLGFIFFVYSVGFQAGPRFFQVFKEDGSKYVVLVLIVAAVGMAVAVGAAKLFGLAPGYSAGMLAGAMTSTPTLAAAQDAVNSGIAHLPPGITKQEVNTNITVAYAITYVFGLIGLILLVKLLPRFFGVDLKAEAAKLAKEQNKSVEEDEDETAQSKLFRVGLPVVRIYRVTNPEITGKTLNDLKFLQTTGCVLLKLKRGNEVFTPGPDTILEQGDVVAAVGYYKDHLRCHSFVGEEVYDQVLGEFPIEVHTVVITNNQIAGKTLRDSGVTNKYACFPIKLVRSGIEMPLSLDFVLEKGDILEVAGVREQVLKLAEDFGMHERPIHETDLLTFAFGIVAGVIAGSITIKIGSVAVGLGMASGLLIMGLLVGQIRSHHPTFGQVPAAARFILMELGMLFFLAGVGLRAGHGLVEGIRTAGLTIFLTGVAITVLPVIIGYLVGVYLLKMNPVILLGAITGSMTSTPALGIVNEAAGNSIPALGYAGAYAFANIVLTIAGQVIMLL